MNAVKKYLLLAFIIENVFAQTPYFSSLSFLFYAFLVIGILFFFEGSVFKRDVFRSCKPLYLLALVYILYQFTIGYETLTSRSVLYLVAKVTTFIIIVISVTENWSFYAERAPKVFSILVLFILVYNLATGNAGSVDNRQLIGFTNSNTTSSLAAFAFAGFLFFGNRRNVLFTILAMLVCLYAVLAGGSRKGILILVIILLMWKGFSIKLIPVLLLLYIPIVLMITKYDVQLAGVERISETITGEMGTNRDSEREAAKIMIEEKPWTGWGFEAQNRGRAAIVSQLSSHNGYLETLKFMGLPFGFLWFLVLFTSIFPLLKYYKSNREDIRYHLTILVALIVSAFYEALFVGIHELSTNLMFVSLAVLTTYRYNEINAEVSD